MIKKINNHYTIELVNNENPYGLEEENLYTLATRNNVKRRFLFVSKVLGKHLSVNPNHALAVSRLLAMRYYEAFSGKEATDRDQVIKAAKSMDTDYRPRSSHEYNIQEKSLVIGFAETATGLGHAVFDALNNAMGYYHTTRADISSMDEAITFEEEHSHATSHRVYESSRMKLEKAKHIILVDDEISTGNTLINIMRSINRKYGIKSFSILTLLDWRNKANCDKMETFSKELGLDATVYSLLKGEIVSVENGGLELDEIKQHKIFSKELIADHHGKTETETHMFSSPFTGYTGRFGINKTQQRGLCQYIADLAEGLQSHVKGKTLILGTEEYMYIPMKIASELKGDIAFKSTTRSPIYPFLDEAYPIKSGVNFSSVYSEDVDNYVYNLKEEAYDTILLMVEKTAKTLPTHALTEKLSQFSSVVKTILFSADEENEARLPKLGSYDEKDVTFLLKEISAEVVEQDNDVREKAIQSGVHYSEMLPIEYEPTEEYINIFYKSLETFSEKLALAVAVTAEKIIKKRGEDIVLVSLARAGTPAGVLLKKYLQHAGSIEVAHYSISIIRGKGIDENALKYILNKHPYSAIQFLDGWTGKGAITKELDEALALFEKRYGSFEGLCSELAVLADPGHCSTLYGTREDFLIPNACLNSTISGLLSRTVLRDDIIGDKDFHGVKYYKNLEHKDLSNYYIETITRFYDKVLEEAKKIASSHDDTEEPKWLGIKDVKKIQDDFDIENIHFVKPGIGETTRVLLRRIPWKILINKDSENLEHVLQLAAEKNIPVEAYPLEAYHCCGIVKTLKGE